MEGQGIHEQGTAGPQGAPGPWVLALAILILNPAAQADAGDAPQDGSPPPPAYPAGTYPSGPGEMPPLNATHPANRWVDEVRAQRQAREERHKASREAFEARRRAADPLGAAQQEDWEEEVERRREARRLRMEQDREHFRSLGPTEPLPWGGYDAMLPPPDLVPGEALGVPSEATAHPFAFPLQPIEPPPETAAYPPVAPAGRPSAVPGGSPYSPQAWDNLWYFRGY